MSVSLSGGAFGLLGPNGSGKTTFINLITGQLKPTIGNVRVFGRVPTSNDSILRRIGLCPALETSYPGLSGVDWVTYLTRLHGFSRYDARHAAEKALELVGMTEHMHRAMSGYSLGMRQRSKLAQAIAHGPELLILDEPFNGLDPVGRIEMTEYLKTWVRDGKSLILASHVLHEVEAVEPSFLLMSGGRLLASGSPSEVRALMTHCPNVFSIQSSNSRKLAELILRDIDVDQIEIDKLNDTIMVSTRDSAELYEKLTTIVEASGITIRRVSSSDESLQELFTNLMKIHRGEI